MTLVTCQADVAACAMFQHMFQHGSWQHQACRYHRNADCRNHVARLYVGAMPTCMGRAGQVKRGGQQAACTRCWCCWGCRRCSPRHCAGGHRGRAACAGSSWGPGGRARCMQADVEHRWAAELSATRTASHSSATAQVLSPICCPYSAVQQASSARVCHA